MSESVSSTVEYLGTVAYFVLDMNTVSTVLYVNHLTNAYQPRAT